MYLPPLGTIAGSRVVVPRREIRGPRDRSTFSVRLSKVRYYNKLFDTQ